jgi:hypothetical protein
MKEFGHTFGIIGKLVTSKDSMKVSERNGLGFRVHTWANGACYTITLIEN